MEGLSHLERVLSLVAIPSSFGRLLCHTPALRSSHGFQPTLPAYLSAFPAHFRHDTGTRLSVYLSGKGHNSSRNLVLVSATRAYSLLHSLYDATLPIRRKPLERPK